MEIGLDISDKKIYAALVDNLDVIESIDESIYSHKRDNNKKIVEKVLALIDEVFNSEVESIGLSLPSKLDIKKGVIYDLEKIPYWKGIGLKKIIEKEFRIPAVINNDINCFLLGEKYHGLCKDFQNILGISLDSNVGASLVVDNKIFLGQHPYFHNIKCLSEACYHWVNYYRKSYAKTVEELNLLFSSFDEQWVKNPHHEAWKILGTLTGRLISIILSNYNPQIIVLGGNLSRFYSYFCAALDKYLEKFLHPRILVNIIIVTSLVNNSRPLGAAAMCTKNCYSTDTALK